MKKKAVIIFIPNEIMLNAILFKLGLNNKRDRKELRRKRRTDELFSITRFY